MPEIVGETIRIPVDSKKHKKHRIRTITISDARQIRALYCGICKRIITYLFDTSRWTMRTAQAWVREHQDGGKAMEFDAVVIDGNEVLIEDLIEAYKTREEMEGEGAREKARAAQKTRSKKYGIAILEDVGNITKPSEWEDVPESQWGDPVNWRYPLHDEAHVRNAAARFAQEDRTYRGRGVIEKRIDKAKRKFKIGEYREKALDDWDDDWDTDDDALKAATEAEKKAQQARGEKYGISIRKGGNVTKPSEWAEAPDSQWGDPVNYAYPCPNEEQTRAALRYWGQARNKAKYSEEDQATITARLKKFAKKFGIGEADEKALDDWDEKSLSFGEQISLVRRAFEQLTRPPQKPMPTVANEYWWINSDDIFDDYVIAKLGETDKEAYKVPYTMDEEGNVEFAPQDEWEKVEKEWVPSKSFDFHVKRLGETDKIWRIGSYGLIWGSPEMRDLSPWPNPDGTRGEYFTPNTQGLDDIPIKAITFEHDKEVGPEPKKEPIRHTMGLTALERDDAIGRWVEAQVEKRRKYAQYVMDLVDQGQLTFSSETAGHWREVATNGEIKHWRTAGYTLTTHPMEPRLTDVQQLRAYYKSLDMDLAEPDTGGADEKSGLEAAKAITEIELLLLDIEEDKT